MFKRKVSMPSTVKNFQNLVLKLGMLMSDALLFRMRPLLTAFSKCRKSHFATTGLLVACWLLAGCTSAPLAANSTPDLAAISTAAVATVFANLTLSPNSSDVQGATPVFVATPLPAEITDKFYVPMVLVPAGSFTMKSGEGKSSVDVMVGDYYIDTYEVTNQRYMICVHAGACIPPVNAGSYTHPNYYLNPDYANYPVIAVDSSVAAYCIWRGAHLTTEIEWEKAAFGTDGRSYPWGNEKLDGTRANICDKNCYQSARADKSMDDGYTDVAPVGSFPAGASPYGVLDMVGNMNEWVTQVGTAFVSSPGASTTSINSEETRGGSWSTKPSDIPSIMQADSRKYTPDTGKLDRGFRCAKNP